jgi:hypothetical protein
MMRMNKAIRIALALSIASAVYAADVVVSAAHGTVEKVDSASKTIVVKTADGTEHTFHYVDRTAVHGADASADAAKDSWHGVTKGTEVVAHYTKRGAEETAIEIDKVNKGGLDVTNGTVKEIDRGTKKLVVVTTDGTEKPFTLSDHAVTDSGKDIAKGTEKGAKVVVYSSEDAGKKGAHFFEHV